MSSLDLEDILAAAEAGADISIPSYLSIDPVTGQISALFLGNLNIPEPVEATTNGVSWLDATQVVQDRIYGYYDDIAAVHHLEAFAGGSTHTVEIINSLGQSGFVQALPVGVYRYRGVIPFANFNTNNPAAPVVGDVFDLQMSNGGQSVTWRFLYDNGATYPWSFLGGTPLYFYNAGPYSNTITTGFQELLVPYTFQMNGIYFVELECYFNMTATSGIRQCGVNAGGAAPVSPVTLSGVPNAYARDTATVRLAAAIGNVLGTFMASPNTGDTFNQIVHKVTPERIAAPPPPP